MLSVIAISLFCIFLGTIVCLYEIRLIQIKLKSLLDENDSREMVAEFSLVLEDHLITLKGDLHSQLHAELKNQIDQIKQQKKVADEEKWDKFREAFTPPSTSPRVRE